MIKQIFVTIVWCVILYFVGCMAVGAIAGGVASASLGPGENAQTVGAAAGARAVESSRIVIGIVAALITIFGSCFRVLPGTRAVRPHSAVPGVSRDMQRWARTRELGRSKFIWLYGVVFWGVTAGISWALLMVAFQGWHRAPILFTTALIGFPIGGYLFGITAWKRMESKYEDTIMIPQDTE